MDLIETADSVPGFYSSIEKKRTEKLLFYSKQVLIRGQPRSQGPLST